MNQINIKLFSVNELYVCIYIIYVLQKYLTDDYR